jgi:DNA-binding XRE family transcriptional regulator
VEEKSRQKSVLSSAKRNYGMPSRQNVIGPTVRKLRYERGWTQAMLTGRCAGIGWHINENTIAKIEAGFRCVSDMELVFLAQALGVKLHDLFPNEPQYRKLK